MLENIEDALNALNYEDALLYVQQATLDLENLQSYVEYMHDELRDIAKIQDDEGGLEIKIQAGKIENKCLVVQVNLSALYLSLSSASAASDLSSVLMALGSARNDTENIIMELKQAQDEHSSLSKMVNPDDD